MPIPAKPTITPPPSPLPTRGENPTTFSNNINALVAWYPDLTDNLSDSVDWMDLVFTEVESEATAASDSATDAQTAETGAVAAKTAAEAARDNVLSNVNFVGDWADQTGAANVPYSVYHAGGYWQLLADLADVTTVEPGTDLNTWVPAATGNRRITVINTSQNFEKLVSSKFIKVRCVAGGGSGAARDFGTNQYCSGASGGEGVEYVFDADDVPASVTCTPGAGGAPVGPVAATGNSGSDTTFGSLLTARGGKGGRDDLSANGFGGAPAGAEQLFWQRDGNLGLQATISPSSGYGGLGTPGTGSTGGNAITGGAGGGGARNVGGSLSSSTGGVSTTAGDGGDGSAVLDTNAEDGAFPGGGGGGCVNGGLSGAGGDGQIIIEEW